DDDPQYVAHVMEGRRKALEKNGTIKDVAAKLGRAYSTIYRWIRTGKIPPRPDGSITEEFIAAVRAYDEQAKSPASRSARSAKGWTPKRKEKQSADTIARINAMDPQAREQMWKNLQTPEAMEHQRRRMASTEAREKLSVAQQAAWDSDSGDRRR